MSYLLDKRIQQKRFSKIAIGVVLFLILFFFRSNIWNGFSNVSAVVFRPVLVSGHNIGNKFKSVGAYFAFKSSLSLQNQNLQSKLDEANARMANYDTLVADDASMKEILNRKDTKLNMTLANILSKPSQSEYDTLVVDAGSNQAVKVGDLVFALGNVPIGRVSNVYNSSAKIILFTNSGEKTQAIVSSKNVFMELDGRGGGNFEMILPKDFVLQKGDQVVMPGINSYLLAITQSVISDPRDPFEKALLTSPVNIQELKFVEIETSP